MQSPTKKAYLKLKFWKNSYIAREKTVGGGALSLVRKLAPLWTEIERNKDPKKPFFHPFFRSALLQTLLAYRDYFLFF
jgi:hypothetical protein